MLEQEQRKQKSPVVQPNITQNHFSILSLASEEDRNKVRSLLNQKDIEIQQEREMSSKLMEDLERAKRSRSRKRPAVNQDLQSRQAMLIKVKGD